MNFAESFLFLVIMFSLTYNIIGNWYFGNKKRSVIWLLVSVVWIILIIFIFRKPVSI